MVTSFCSLQIIVNSVSNQTKCTHDKPVGSELQKSSVPHSKYTAHHCVYHEFGTVWTAQAGSVTCACIDYCTVVGYYSVSVRETDAVVHSLKLYNPGLLHVTACCHKVVDNRRNSRKLCIYMKLDIRRFKTHSPKYMCTSKSPMFLPSKKGPNISITISEHTIIAGWKIIFFYPEEAITVGI